ncbi:toxin SymE, type I toxin-antitoxin system family protein [Enterobacteriaceae bacterium ATCC 29904]|nr:toxin SymE, type I toxin-antitoxin system family protein [Enterobacteriaceae bacterium ATCC 29904]
MMAKRDSTSQRTLSKAQRRMTIGYVSIRHFYHHNHQTTWYSRSPSLRLNGNWLAEGGFSTDTPVTVSVEHGRLVIEPVKG